VKEAATNGESAAENGEDAPTIKTITGILAKVKNNPKMKESDKVETLCVLVEKIIEENNILRSDLQSMSEHISKANQANEAVKKLNSAYKQQIELVQEENNLKIKEEEVKRAECMKSYQSTMNELSTLLETHTGQNSRLRDENVSMAEKLTTLCEDSEKREGQVQARLKEYELQVKLLEAQVMKAQLEKAEVKADMTKERIEIAQELNLEREKTHNLEETVKIMKEQVSIYQAQMDELSLGAGNSTKSFQHFKTQIEKLTKQLVDLDKDTHQWREKYEVSSQQVKKMNTQSLEREKETEKRRARKTKNPRTDG
jgi:chromosome segregation ATPase